MISVLDDLLAALAAITDDDVRRAMRKLTPPEKGETVLGVVPWDHDVWRWLAVMDHYRRLEAKEEYARKFESETEDQATEHHIAEHRCHAFASIAKEMFYLQAQEIVGGAAWTNNVGIRTEYRLVARPPGPSGPLQLMEMLRLPLPEE